MGISNASFGFGSSRKCSKLTHPVKEDLFGRLHDDIIVSHILPLLTTKEVVKTSILCRRWKHFWIQGFGSKLIFSHGPGRVCYDKFERIDWYRGLFTSGINHVLESYPEPTLDELSVKIHFDAKSSNDLENWLEFALRKGVTRLEFDLSPGFTGDLVCKFPNLEKLLALHALCGSNIHQPVRCTGLLNLRDLCLKYVNVSPEVIDFMISNCPSLERLCVWFSNLSTKGLYFCGQSLKLKTLEVVSCYGANINISSCNLVSLQYSGASEALHIQHVRFLSHLSLGQGYCRAFLRTGSQNFSYISQLTKLTLDMSYKDASKHISFPLEFPEFVKLEHLEVKVRVKDDSCVLWPIVLIKASPSLHSFSIEFLFQCEDSEPNPRERRNLLNEMEPVRHQRLKLINIHNFFGAECDSEFIQHLLGICICGSLEQVSVTTVPVSNPCREMFRERARRLSRWVPQGAKLLVVA